MGEAARRWHLSEPFTGVTAYMFYVQENRDHVQAKNPAATFAEVSDLLEDGWKALTDGLRERFMDLERASNASYMRGTAKDESISGRADDTTSTISMITAAQTITSDDDGRSEVTISAHPSVPRPDCIFTIRAASDGRNLMLRDGQVVLDWPDGHGSTLWLCVENRGWLGFRNVVSGKLLGYDISDWLTCAAKNQQEWESFAVRPVPNGGHILLMTHWGSLWPVGAVKERDIDRLAKLGDGVSTGIVWEFLEACESLSLSASSS